MNNYVKGEFKFTPYNETEGDILNSLLCEIGFESFVNTSDGVEAYIKEELFDAQVMVAVINDGYSFSSQIDFTTELIEGKDWNQEWEKNYFTPIVIADRCVIHSSFHKDFPKLEYDIVIDPKMAFGTGHHQTTSLMVGGILDIDLGGKRVTDVGTGTGILAMLSSMCGAESANGIEIDPMAYENAVENVGLNGIDNVTMHLGDASLLADKELFMADVLLANINRNIILGDIDKYASVLVDGGLMLLSGFYSADVDILLAEAKKYGLDLVEERHKDDWTMIILKGSAKEKLAKKIVL
ncbi:MAG: 50S ribosomal protein L11 methyltransferase [Bacteroidales bacterium]